MTTMSLMFSEIRFRWLNFLLSLLAIVAAATLFVGGPTLIAGYSDQTNQLIRAKQQKLQGRLAQMASQQNARLAAMQQETNALLAEMDKQTSRLMRDLGFNVVIVHKDTNMGDFYADFKAVDMPEEYVQRLGTATEITKIRHIVATLQEKFKWNERSVLLAGILPSVTQSHLEKKPPMGYRIQPGTVILGHELGIGRKEKEPITVGEKEFTIAKILPESGTKEDIMLAMELHDAQEVLGKPGKINQIVALECDCKVDRLGEIRAQLEKVLPDTRVTEYRSIAIARAEQRDLVAKGRKEAMEKMKAEGDALLARAKAGHAAILAAEERSRREVEASLTTMFSVLAPLVVLICALWLGLLAWSNVRERRPEIGVLRALGKSSGSIAALFLSKAVLLGLLGGLIGCGIGYLLATSFAPAALGSVQPWLVATIIGAPLVALMATYLPTLVAVRQDPAMVLREQ